MKRSGRLLFRRFVMASYLLESSLAEIVKHHGAGCPELAKFLQRKETQANGLDTAIEKTLVLTLAFDSLKKDIDRRLRESHVEVVK